MRRLTYLLSAPSLLAFSCLLALADVAPAAASFEEWASAPADARARFFVETIAVEGVGRSKPEIIVSESRLVEGRPYTEAELREAMYRIRRLPFLLDAAFSLGKGSERGRYRLLITVDEVESVFFGGDLVFRAVSGVPVEDGLDESLTAGVRFFAGQGLFFAAAGDSEDFQAGYERYRLFDRPVLLRLAYAREGCCAVELLDPGLDPAAGTWTAKSDSERFELTLGLPLWGNHSVRLDASRLSTPSAQRRPFGAGALGELDARGVERRKVELAWIYDTTDDPLFPTRGDTVVAAVGLSRLESGLSEDGGPALRAMRSRRLGLAFHGSRHWPLDARQTVALSLEVRLGRSDVDNLPLRLAGLDLPRFVSGEVDAGEGEIGVRYSRDLSDRRRVARRGELRWETAAHLLYLETSPAFERPIWGVSASTTLAWRTSWGVFRVGLAILDLDGDL